jgi:hypothetical protein
MANQNNRHPCRQEVEKKFPVDALTSNSPYSTTIRVEALERERLQSVIEATIELDHHLDTSSASLNGEINEDNKLHKQPSMIYWIRSMSSGLG